MPIRFFDDGDGRTDSLLVCDKCAREVWIGDAAGYEPTVDGGWVVDWDTEAVVCPLCATKAAVTG
jgi:hypothetical protein